MEGPSLFILKEEAQAFIGKKIVHVSGNSKIDQHLLENQKITDLKSWGKHFIICFPNFFVRIHFLMFGSYRINEEKNLSPRLTLQFKNGKMNFYSCSVKIINQQPEDVYDFETDVMSASWNASKAIRVLKGKKTALLCDALLDQNIFSGVGNIIKNEVLFRIRLHPETSIAALGAVRLRELVKTASDYSFDFFEWKKIYQLKKHWLIYRKKNCPRCDTAVRVARTGFTNRLSYFCPNCQPLLVAKKRIK